MVDGRMMVYAPTHPDAVLCNGTHILEYRLVAEKKLGRRLRKNEIVHHINGDVADNRLENLEEMSRTKHNHRHEEHDKRIRELEEEVRVLRERLDGFSDTTLSP